VSDNPYSWDDEPPQYRRRKTKDEIEKEEAERRHAEFIRDMRKEGRYEAIDDPGFAFEMYEIWEKDKYPARRLVSCPCFRSARIPRFRPSQIYIVCPAKS